MAGAEEWRIFVQLLYYVSGYFYEPYCYYFSELVYCYYASELVYCYYFSELVYCYYYVLEEVLELHEAVY